MDPDDIVDFSPCSSSIHVEPMSTATTVTSTAEIIMQAEGRQEQSLFSELNVAQIEGDNNLASLEADRLDSQQDTESLVTADDVSSSMFSDDVNTAIEAPQAAKRNRVGSEEEECGGSKAKKGRVQMLCKFFESKALIQDSGNQIIKKGEPKELLPAH
ncbi:hypothetical protein TELCIR_09297 [Teladorsagia circumcincta]|uniref:Uncharacterized protein n=1 Tax=Teladorsagia circumcincta TaxID=45464 RepID=A0A2G9UHC8_TELCI|nr:hypothetical protein TELCIR_09297 [Teladorsagia circumcincta]